MVRKPSVSRSGSSPKRETPRSRAAARAAARATRQPGKQVKADPSELISLDKAAADEPISSARRRTLFTGRFVVLGVVLIALFLTYFSSLRVFFNQRAQMDQARSQIAQYKSQIDDLQDKVQRFSDSEYVKAQARQRLGWVVPGETGYQVIGVDGKVIGDSATILTDSSASNTEPVVDDWNAKLVTSVLLADDILVVSDTDAAEQSPSNSRVIGPNSGP